MPILKGLLIFFFIINLTYSMYYLTNFHTTYPDALLITVGCGETIRLSCQIESENSSSSTAPIMWFRLYENAYPQPLILGDRQLIDDQRYTPRKDKTNHYLDIADIKKSDEGYYLCKLGNGIQISFNLTIFTNTCIDIVPERSYITIDEPIQLVCRIRSVKSPNEVDSHVEWTHNNNNLFSNLTEYTSNYSAHDEVLYKTLLIKHASRTDTGVYTCRYGEYLSAQAEVFVDQYPGGTKSRRLIALLREKNLSSKASLRTVVSCFYIVYQILLFALVAPS